MKYSCCHIFLELWVLVFAGFLLLNKNIFTAHFIVVVGLHAVTAQQSGGC